MTHDSSPSSRLVALVAPRSQGDVPQNRTALQRLLQLRAFVTLIGLLGLLLLKAFSNLDLPLVAVSLIAACSALSLLVGYWRLNRRSAVAAGELLGHLLTDTILLVLLLSLTGGISNPLISYLLVLLAVSATLLPRLMVISFATGNIVIYTSFLLLDLATDQQMAMGDDSPLMTFQLHLVGMWVIFVVSAILITVFVTRMAEGIRTRELTLAQAREEALRSEQLIAIGTLAAGTAHALGTPLSTMSVLLSDLDAIATENLAVAEVKEDISTLRQQVARCRNSLGQLTRYYHKDENRERGQLSIVDFIADIREYLTNIHPAASIDFAIEALDKVEINSDPSIKHAVINIIENGIKAARERVSITLTQSSPADLGTNQSGADSAVKIVIADDGPGIPAEVMENLGEPFITVSNQGMGLGIYLANASIQRLGGSIKMQNDPAGGARTSIILPLSSKTAPAEGNV